MHKTSLLAISLRYYAHAKSTGRREAAFGRLSGVEEVGLDDYGVSNAGMYLLDIALKDYRYMQRFPSIQKKKNQPDTRRRTGIRHRGRPSLFLSLSTDVRKTDNCLRQEWNITDGNVHLIFIIKAFIGRLYELQSRLAIVESGI